MRRCALVALVLIALAPLAAAAGRAGRARAGLRLRREPHPQARATPDARGRRARRPAAAALRGRARAPPGRALRPPDRARRAPVPAPARPAGRRLARQPHLAAAAARGPDPCPARRPPGPRGGETPRAARGPAAPVEREHAGAAPDAPAHPQRGGDAAAAQAGGGRSPEGDPDRHLRPADPGRGPPLPAHAWPEGRRGCRPGHVVGARRGDADGGRPGRRPSRRPRAGGVWPASSRG